MPVSAVESVSVLESRVVNELAARPTLLSLSSRWACLRATTNQQTQS